MNFCIGCNSFYAQPGTCNCYAPGGARAPRLSIATDGTFWPINQSVCPVCNKNHESTACPPQVFSSGQRFP